MNLTPFRPATHWSGEILPGTIPYEVTGTVGSQEQISVRNVTTDTQFSFRVIQI